MKEQIEIKEVREDIMRMFDLKENEYNEFQSSVTDNKFSISKNQYSRNGVVGGLSVYFKDKEIKGGYLIVDEVTFMFTIFEIKEGKTS